MASTTDRRDTPAPGARRRADAERNIAAILNAGVGCLSRDPAASVAEVAKAAGVGRVTLYGHFPSREALIDAVFAHTVARSEAALDAVPLDEGSPSDALSRLIRTSWRIIAEHRGVLAAAQRHLAPARLRAHHDQAMARVERLIARGQEEGEFRTDLPRPWLVATFYTLMHAAADETDADRLEEPQAAGVLAATILAALGDQTLSTTHNRASGIASARAEDPGSRATPVTAE